MPEGFVPVVTPDLARPDVVEALGFSPRGEESQIYSVAGHELCLIGTSEITLGGMYAELYQMGFKEDGEREKSGPVMVGKHARE